MIDYGKSSSIIDDNQLPSMVFQCDRFLVYSTAIVMFIQFC